MGPVLVAELYRPRGEPMDASTAVAVHALWAKIGSWVSAEQMLTTHDATHGIRGMLDPDSVGEAQMLAAQELACHTHTSYATAMSHVSLVERVAQALPASWEALDRGEITVSHLKAVERETRNCPPRVAEAVDTQVIPLAVDRGWTASETAKAARKLLIALDPGGAKDREAAAKDASDVEFYPLPDGPALVRRAARGGTHAGSSRPLRDWSHARWACSFTSLRARLNPAETSDRHRPPFSLGTTNRRGENRATRRPGINEHRLPDRVAAAHLRRVPLAAVHGHHARPSCCSPQPT